MKAVYVSKDGANLIDTKQLTVEDIGDDEILIKNVAVASNLKDWKVVIWYRWEGVEGNDCAGIVEGVGKNVKHFRKGDKVASYTTTYTDSKYGTYSEYSVAPLSSTILVHPKTSFEEAATVPLALSTAVVGVYCTLKVPVSSENGETPKTKQGEAPVIVIYGGGSSVGGYAVQLAKKSGLFVIAIAGSNKDLALQMGADVVLDYRSEKDIATAVKSVSKHPVRYIFDAVSTPDTIQDDIKCLEDSGGKISYILADAVSSDVAVPSNVELLRTRASWSWPGGLAVSLALATDGHDVTILEGAKEFNKAGAGIHVPPNSARLLTKWGVDLASIKKDASSGYNYVSWNDGKTIVKYHWSDSPTRYGASYYFMHKVDFHAALLSAARKSGVKILLDSLVTEYDFEKPSVKVEDGRAYDNSDLIIAADGIKSLARPGVVGHPDYPIDTGDVAYRILLSGKDLLSDPELENLIKEPCATSWCGPDAHIVGYPLRDGQMYNIVVCATNFNEFDDKRWVVTGDTNELSKRFAGWKGQVPKLCALVDNYTKWKLFDLKPLNRWYHPSGKVTLLGDSCHSMLPYLAQGAAQAVEDAAVLRLCLRKSSNYEISKALTKYQSLRKPRVEIMQRQTRRHQRILHIPDGDARDKRDAAMRVDSATNPLIWGRQSTRDWLFGFDPEESVHNESLCMHPHL